MTITISNEGLLNFCECFNSQMEKYSKHLEAIVAERTQDLLQEKQKTDRLLYSELSQSHMIEINFST